MTNHLMMMVVVKMTIMKSMSIQTCGLSECSNVGDFALEETLKTVDLIVLRITIRMIMVNVMIAIMILEIILIHLCLLMLTRCRDLNQVRLLTASLLKIR